MRFSLGRKLVMLIALLGLVSIAISGFAIQQLRREQARAATLEGTWRASLQAKALAQAIDHTVAEATNLYSAEDRQEARTHLDQLVKTLGALEATREDFAATMAERLPAAERQQLDMMVRQFAAYQRETADLGLSVSPKAALLQATDEATVRNRVQMVSRINAISREMLATLESERTEAAQASARARTTLLAVPALVLGLGIAAAYWLVRAQVTAPLDNLRSAMQALQNADYSAEVPGLVRKDEIGAMARAIASFKAGLQEKEALDRAAQNRRQLDASRAERLGNATAGFETDAGETLRHLTDFAALLGQSSEILAQSASDTTAGVSIVTSAAEQSAQAVDSVARASEEFAASARLIAERAAASSLMAESVLTDTHALGQTSGHLSDAAQAIGSVGALIHKVAHHTNLLALNATIEAARAGEAGKGFAVVAGEVKSLSIEIARATSEISHQVDAIQLSAGRTKTQIDDIGQHIRAMNAISSEIAESASQQGRTSEEIARAMGVAAVQVRRVSHEIAGVHRTTLSNEAQADELRRHARRVNASTGDLDTNIQRFLGEVRIA